MLSLNLVVYLYAFEHSLQRIRVRVQYKQEEKNKQAAEQRDPPPPEVQRVLKKEKKNGGAEIPFDKNHLPALTAVSPVFPSFLFRGCSLKSSATPDDVTSPVDEPPPAGAQAGGARNLG